MWCNGSATKSIMEIEKFFGIKLNDPFFLIKQSALSYCECCGG
jgi:hypothetical protein